MALVGLDGSIYWLCLPRFDSEPVFCGLLDRERGGHFTITPDELTEARQRYEPDTGVLVTELRSPTGLVRLTDALALRSGADLTDDVPGGRGELIRSAVVLDGNVRLRVELEPRGGGGRHARVVGREDPPQRKGEQAGVQAAAAVEMLAQRLGILVPGLSRMVCRSLSAAARQAGTGPGRPSRSPMAAARSRATWHIAAE